MALQDLSFEKVREERFAKAPASRDSTQTQLDKFAAKLWHWGFTNIG